MITLSFTGNHSGPPMGTKSSAKGRRIAKPSVEQSIAPLEKKRRLIKNIIGNEKTLVGHIIAITDNSMAYDSNCQIFQTTCMCNATFSYVILSTLNYVLNYKRLCLYKS